MQPVNVAQLQAAGFRPAPTEVPRRLIAAVNGKEKDGKTHFSLTFPSPIFFFDIDVGTEGVVEKFKVGSTETGPPKDIWIYTIRVPKGAQQVTYESLWSDMKAKLQTAWNIGEGTVIIDTGTEAYELNRLARFGKLTQVMPHHYMETNAEWRELIKLAYDAEKMNTVFIHKMKPKWVNNVRTAEYEVSGFSEMGYLTQINITTFRDPQQRGAAAFRAVVENCRRNPAANGVLMSVPLMLNAEFLLKLVHG